MDYVSDLIAQIWTTDRCLEAMNALTVADPHDYAMLQGCGGQNHARKSGIVVVITDKSPGAVQRNGGKAPKIKATVPPVEFSIAKSIAESNLGGLYCEEGAITDLLNVVESLNAKSGSVLSVLSGAINLIGETAGKLIIGKAAHEQLPQIICDGAKAQRELLRQIPDSQAQANSTRKLSFYRDWEYTQTRVHTFDSSPDGRVGVAVLALSRKQYQNEVRQAKPWTVYISQFRAFPVTHANGTVSYDRTSKADELMSRVKLDDAQMYEFCHRVERFEQVWEIANCCSPVRERQEAKMQKKG